MYKVVEIFHSIDGEGKRSGLSATFIRLHGCNLRCSYCDSMYANQGDDYEKMSLEDIVAQVESYGDRRITLTGGEPLRNDNVWQLVDYLAVHGYDVNIETNGSIPLKTVTPRGVFYTMDLKCPSSRMHKEMCLENLELLSSDDVLKLVVGNEGDMKWAMRTLEKHPTRAQVYVSPLFGEMNLGKMAEFAMVADWRVQVQLHKILWDPNRRGV